MSIAPPATALIADDEPLPRLRLLEALAAAWPSLRVVAEVGNGVDAWDAWLEHEPLLCFLDIRMPGLTGIEVAQRIRGRAQVVFVTMPGDHALAAFDDAAVDYVVKPVDAGKLGALVEQMQARLEISGRAAGEWQPLLDRLAGQVRKPAPLDAIGAGEHAVPMGEVVYLEAESRQTRVVHGGGELLVRVPLKELLAQLDPNAFWQIHRNTVVNHRHVAEVVHLADDSMALALQGRSEKLPVARHFQRLFPGR